MRRALAGPAGVALALLAALPGPTSAQAVVDPGGVVTTVVTMDARAGGPDSVGYRVEMADGFRLFAPARGTTLVTDGVVRLPLTFGVAPTATAGLVEAGRVVVSWPGHRAEQSFSIRVRPRYKLRFRLDTETVSTPPERPVELKVYLGNRGNAVDTVDIGVQAPDGWTRQAVPSRLILAPGDTAVSTVQVVPPRDATPGLDRVIQVAAESGAGRNARSARVIVVAETQWFGDLASLPSTVFLGSTSGTTGTGGVAIQAAGDVRPGTRVSLDFRHTDQPLAAPALRRALAGPDLRLTFTNPEWRLAAGDVYSRTDLFTGPSFHGRGVDARWTGNGLGAALLVASPANGFGEEEGHLVRAAGSVDTRVGRFTGIVSSLRRKAALFDGFDIRSAGIEYATSLPVGQLTVEAGAMEVATDSGDSAIGPALDAQFQTRSDRGTLLARLRTVPATVARTSAYGDEASLSGTLHVVGGLSALGWGFLTRSPLLGVEDPDRSRGVAAGLRYAMPHTGTQVQLTGRTRENVYPSAGGRSTRQTLQGSLDVPLGAFVLEVDGDLGRFALADTAPRVPFHSVRTGVRWARGDQWGSFGLGLRKTGSADASLFADLAGSVRVGPAELRGGLSADFTRPLADATSVWTGTTVDVTREMAVTFGVDYSPVGGGDRWQLSLGVARRFALPLPIRREPAVHGVVYEDRNGNRTRDPGEPVLAEIPVRFGPLAATTDENGEFRFMEEVRGGLSIETAELPLGLMVPADVYLPASGYVEVPLVRTAALDLTLFLDRDGDGVRDEAEEAAAGVVVSVVAPDGRTRDVAVDARGHARISALSPGDYTIRVHPPATRRTGGPPMERQISVPPGGLVEQTIAVPLRRREIRIPDGQRLDLQNRNQSSADARL